MGTLYFCCAVEQDDCRLNSIIKLHLPTPLRLGDYEGVRGKMVRSEWKVGKEDGKTERREVGKMGSLGVRDAELLME